MAGLNEVKKNVKVKKKSRSKTYPPRAGLNKLNISIHISASGDCMNGQREAAGDLEGGSDFFFFCCRGAEGDVITLFLVILKLNCRWGI